jgi:hypothetical protein
VGGLRARFGQLALELIDTIPGIIERRHRQIVAQP